MSPEDPDAIFSPICRELLSTFESPIFSCSSNILSEAAEFVGFDNEAYVTHGIQVCKENINLMCSFE
jgi:tRNA A37 threonylcarbamoyladenosine synthetase subunit TsaC/SUA5/YrdC